MSFKRLVFDLKAATILSSSRDEFRKAVAKA